MIKEAVVGLFSGTPRAKADRYYIRYHGPDVIRISGPWLRGYVSYRAYDPPVEAVERFGGIGGRFTELWFTSLEEFLTRPPLYSQTLPLAEERPPVEPANVLVPGTPTETFLEKGFDPEELTSVARWVCAVRYPNGVSLEEGEKWYKEVHGPETARQPGLLRSVSFHSVHEKGTVNGKPGEPNPIRWIRISEFWYEDMAAWRKAVIESPPKYTPPPWGGQYPFVNMVSNFIDLKPDLDFIRGSYVIP